MKKTSLTPIGNALMYTKFCFFFFAFCSLYTQESSKVGFSADAKAVDKSIGTEGGSIAAIQPPSVPIDFRRFGAAEKPTFELSGVYAETRVYVDIVGDLFHAGHIEFLRKAKSFGDYLIVGVLADDTVEEYKRRPVLCLEDRVKVIRACKYVDEVIVAPPLRLTEQMVRDLKINYVVHGDDFNQDTLEDQYGVALKLGIFRTVPYTPGISTTAIIKRIVNRHHLGDF